jgi:hypothetical protein
MLAILAVLVLANFFIVYRKAKQYNYYSERINIFLTIILIISGYVLMGIGGQVYRQYFVGR